MMIKDTEILRKFESNFISDQGCIPYEQSQKLFTAMWKEGVMLGVFPSADPQAGVEVNIRIARILNHMFDETLARIGRRYQAAQDHHVLRI